MKEQELYNFEKKLAALQKVEAPEFLFTRIQQKLKKINNEQLSFKWGLALGLSFSIMLLLNLNIISDTLNRNSSELNVLKKFDLEQHNQLY